ncbi:Maltase A3 [Trichoplax sp. H2]|nr:Maltase A3 [Trichoplax sp. H2]|eukprot:RDD39344.1 Maltase A3 [Trichoplax sp. H2]
MADVAAVKIEDGTLDTEEAAYRNRRRRCYVFVFLLICIIGAAILLLVAFTTGPSNSLKTNLRGREFTYHPTCDQNLQWWQTSIIYQIYPRSFQDSNNDGVGDLKGIEQRLSHFKDIHVDAVWLSPMFKSPMKDFGYDVSDYTDVDPIFGNMADFDSLLAAMQKQGIKLILDFVPNHSSDQHEWFIESRSSLNNPKRQWYMWAEPKGMDADNNPIPPNNWISVFSGSMWEFDNKTNQFYLHQFLVEQPDLNYTNPEVVEASKNVLRFWLNKGVDGFRIDAIKHVYENPKLPDEVPDPNYRPGVDAPYSSLIHNETTDFPPLHWLNRQWRSVFDEYSKTKPRFAVGEAYDPIDIIMLYYGTQQQPEFHFPFNFFLLTLPKWTGNTLNQTVHDWMSKMPACGWPNWVVGNHDNHRISNRRGPKLVKAVNAVNLLLPGTPTTYYGEEINMRNVKISLADTQDPFGLQNPDIYESVSRDPERTPMQWDDSPNAGFSASGIKTWLPIADDYKSVNVKVEKANPNSHLNFYRSLATLRQSSPAWRYPNYRAVYADDSLFAFLRFHSTDSHAFLVTVNLGSATITRDLSMVSDVGTVRLASNPALTGEVNLHQVTLTSGEVVVYQINQSSGGH